jgi:pilus assembly protein Flp/PilA
MLASHVRKRTIAGGHLMTKFAKKFLADESGATAIEYGLIAALISVAIIAAAKNMGNNVSKTFSNVATNINPTTK